MGIYEKTFRKEDARHLWTKLIRKATRTHYQIRQHFSGTYQVIKGRYSSDTNPAFTANTLEGAIYLAKRN